MTRCGQPVKAELRNLISFSPYHSAFASIGINVSVHYYGYGSVNAGTA